METLNNSKPKDTIKKTIAQVAVVTAFITAFLGSTLNVAVPQISADLHISAANTGWIITIYSLITTALSVPFGKIADSFGRRWVFLGGLIVMAAANLAMVFANSFALVIVCRGLQGVAAAMLFATNMALILSAYPPNQKGKAIGIMSTGTYIGLTIGPAVGGFITALVGWKFIFLFAGVVSTVMATVAILRLPKDTELPPKTGNDIPGNILFIVMVTMVMYGFASLADGWVQAVILCVGLVLALVFIRLELKVKHPIIKVEMFFRQPAYAFSNFAALFSYSATFGVGYFLSIYLQTEMGCSSMIAGLVLIAQPLVMAMFTAKMGALADKIPPYKLATAGMGINAVCLIFFAFLGRWTPLWLLVIALLVFGFGVSMFSSPNNAAIMSFVEPADYGVASSILATMRTLGQGFGICIATLVVSATMGTLTLAEASDGQMEHTLRIAFLIYAAITVVGMIMSLQRKKV